MNAIPDNDQDSVLKTRQEAPIWVAADVVLLAVLLLMTFLFQPTGDHLPGPDWFTGPLLGWLIGNVIGWMVPTSARIPSWTVPTLGLLLVVLFTLLPADWRSVHQPIAGFVIGVGCSFLIKRSLAARRSTLA